MKNAKTTKLPDGMVKIRPSKGYRLVDLKTGRRYSEAVTKYTEDFDTEKITKK